MGRLKSDVLVAETVQGSDWYPAISMSIVKIRSAPVRWDKILLESNPASWLTKEGISRYALPPPYKTAPRPSMLECP
jgi:hypothetical protein